MLLPTPAIICDRLMGQTSIPLAQVSGTGGIYALEDETGVVRYVGETIGPFFDRIYNRHVGGDDNSHKYSSVFNAGRLWHLSGRDVSPIKRALSDPSDGKWAKNLRRQFARSRCHARIFSLPGASKSELKTLEDGVLALLPAQNRAWNESRQLNAYEPKGLDDFLMSLSLPSSVLQALDRQGERWSSLSPSERIIVRR